MENLLDDTRSNITWANFAEDVSKGASNQRRVGAR